VGEHRRLEVLLRRTVQGSVGNNALTILEVRCSSTQWRLMQGCVTVRGLDGTGMLKYLFFGLPYRLESWLP